MYPEASVVHLMRCHSDHCPLLMEMQPRVHENRKKLFKFQTCWLSDCTFPRVVSQAWRQMPNLAKSIETFNKEATKWNKEQFGYIFTRKRNIMARLNGIQKAMSVKPSTFLLNLENDLLRDLDTMLNQEKELWAIKSRVNWMFQGDRNTAFYYVSTLVRRKRNNIVAIKDLVGEWISLEKDIKELVRSGYSAIYTMSFSSASCLPPTITPWQTRLSEEEKCGISGGASEEEIKAVLRLLKPFKAPGPDGLHAIFFQRFWLTVGNSVKTK